MTQNVAKKLHTDLHAASFRSIPFEVERTEMEAGRRAQVHEYPQRDKPWVEDLGRATRTMQIEAFVLGPDYLARAQKLLDAVEEPGPGTLIHPWLGTLTASVKDASVAFDQSLGVARFSLTFVESGELAFPQAVEATQAFSRNAAERIETEALAAFSQRYSLDKAQDVIGQWASGDLIHLVQQFTGLRIPGLEFLGAAKQAAHLSDALIGLVNNPPALGLSLAGLLGIGALRKRHVGRAETSNATSQPYFTGQQSIETVAQTLVRHASATAFRAQKPFRNRALSTAVHAQTTANRAALLTLTRQLLLAQAAAASSLAPALVFDDAIELRNMLATALDAEALTATDASFDALTEARMLLWKDLTTRARNSARLKKYTPLETLPALTIAYDMYEDATRDAEITVRNKIRHPGFVPPEPLRVLTR